MMRKGLKRTIMFPASFASGSKSRQFFVGFIALFIVIALFYSAGVFTPAPQYVLVIDAGSSGTRMNAFVWRPPATAGALPSLEAIPPDAAPHKVPRRALDSRRAYKRVETEPGLDRFADSPTSIGPKALEPLLEWARAVVPSGRWASTPVFLLGTAGLRKLRGADRERVLEEARKLLGSSGFRFDRPWARVMEGADEGVFAWVALNHAAGTLGSNSTLGTLDLGGSSLQVTFAPEKDAAPGKSRVVNVSLMGAQHSLVTHSHYHFGLDDAFERSVTILLEAEQRRLLKLQEEREQRERDREEHKAREIAAAAEQRAKEAAAANAAEEVEAAAAAAAAEDQQKVEEHQKNGDATEEAAAISGGDGAVETTRRALLETQQQRQRQLPEVSEVKHPCLHSGYRKLYKRVPLRGKSPHPEALTLVGSYDAAACAELATAVVTAPADCSAPPCALEDGPQPGANQGRFVALAGFFVVAHFFRVSPAAGLPALRSAGDTFCGLRWPEVESRYGGELSPETYCFRARYTSSLLSTGLNLKDGQVEIAEGTAGWTLGAALAEGHRLAKLGQPEAFKLTAAWGGDGSWLSWWGGSGHRPVAGDVASKVAAWILGALAAVAIVVAVLRLRRGLLERRRRKEWATARRRSGNLSDSIASGEAEWSAAGAVRKISPSTGSWQKVPGWAPADPPANNGTIAARSLSRSSTFGRRLSALEGGGSDSTIAFC